MSEESYSLLVSFDDQSDSFVHGFEAGKIWQMMSDGTPVENQTIHVTNIELIQRMASRRGWIADITPYDSTYAYLTTRKQTTP